MAVPPWSLPAGQRELLFRQPATLGDVAKGDEKKVRIVRMPVQGALERYAQDHAGHRKGRLSAAVLQDGLWGATQSGCRQLR